MSLLTKAINKIKYTVSKSVSDPEADAYAKQQADQAVQNAAAKKREAQAQAQADAKAEAHAQADADAQDLVKRSQFKPKRAVSNIASGVLKAFSSLFLILIMLYGGHLAANKAIGYRVPFRVFTFVWGAIFFFYYIPKSLFNKYYYGLTDPFYSFLPLSTYVPKGDLESIFLGPFCYTEDNSARLARAAVQTLYEEAFKKSQANST